MVKLSGKSVYKGIVLGPIAVLKKDDQQVKRVKITDADAELGRLGKAGEQAKEQLQALYDKALKEVGEASAAIFEVQNMRWLLPGITFLKCLPAWTMNI